MMKPVPAMTSHKAVWSAIATSLVSVLLMMTSVIPIDEAAFADNVEGGLTLLAAVGVQAAVTWATAYFKRNYLK